MSAGLPVPKRVFGHGFLLNKGEKMSKSVGNVVDPVGLADLYGVDPLRYFVLREVPFGQDGSYSHEAIVNRLNADLANDLGNLAQRSLTMIARNCGGQVPQAGEPSAADRALLALADALPEKARGLMQDLALHAVLAEIWAVVAEANRYFAGQEPWSLRKTDPARMEAVLATTAEVLRAVGILVQPFIPNAAARLLDLLAVSPRRGRWPLSGRIIGSCPDGAPGAEPDLPALRGARGVSLVDSPEAQAWSIAIATSIRPASPSGCPRCWPAPRPPGSTGW